MQPCTFLAGVALGVRRHSRHRRALGQRPLSRHAARRRLSTRKESPSDGGHSDRANQPIRPAARHASTLALLALCHHDNGHVAVSWDTLQSALRVSNRAPSAATSAACGPPNSSTTAATATASSTSISRRNGAARVGSTETARGCYRNSRSHAGTPTRRRPPRG